MGDSIDFEMYGNGVVIRYWKAGNSECFAYLIEGEKGEALKSELYELDRKRELLLLGAITGLELVGQE